MTENNSSIKLKLPLHLRQVGTPRNDADVGHRIGWPWVLDLLRPYHDENEMLLDDFVERSFQEKQQCGTWQEPFVGIFHHPHNMPLWISDDAHPDLIFNSEWWNKTGPFLRGGIALSKYLAGHLENRLAVPFQALKHPMPTPEPEFHFNPEKFQTTQRPKLVQIGWYLRNQFAIYQLDAPGWLQKVHLHNQARWIEKAAIQTRKFSETAKRKYIGETQRIQRIDNLTYDRLLTECVVFVELFDTSANNVVSECIVRNTPILINSLPATREYLGDNYPLFYEDFNTAGKLLTRERIIEAHYYLKNLDKSEYDGKYFALKVLDFMQSFKDE